MLQSASQKQPVRLPEDHVAVEEEEDRGLRKYKTHGPRNGPKSVPNGVFGLAERTFQVVEDAQRDGEHDAEEDGVHERSLAKRLNLIENILLAASVNFCQHGSNRRMNLLFANTRRDERTNPSNCQLAEGMPADALEHVQQRHKELAFSEA